MNLDKAQGGWFVHEANVNIGVYRIGPYPTLEQAANRVTLSTGRKKFYLHFDDSGELMGLKDNKGKMLVEYDIQGGMGL